MYKMRHVSGSYLDFMENSRGNLIVAPSDKGTVFSSASKEAQVRPVLAKLLKDTDSGFRQEDFTWVKVEK